MKGFCDTERAIKGKKARNKMNQDMDIAINRLMLFFGLFPGKFRSWRVREKKAKKQE